MKNKFYVQLSKVPKYSGEWTFGIDIERNWRGRKNCYETYLSLGFFRWIFFIGFREREE